MRGEDTGAFGLEPDPVPIDAYGDAPSDEPVPHGDADAFAGDDLAPLDAPAPSSAKQEASRPSRRASSAPDFDRMAHEAAARTSSAGLPPEPTDANTSASIDATGPNGEPLSDGFESSGDLAALLAVGGFEGARVEEMRE